MSVFFRQLPARSPLSLRALGAGALQALRVGRDARAGLERLLRDRFAADGVLLCASGTHALQLAFAALRVTRSDDAIVLLPAYTCFEVATAAVGAGVTAALYDIDPDTLQPDWVSVKAAASGRTVGALVVAPLYGAPVDWEVSHARARELGALLIEDAAQAHGSAFGARAVGSFGDLTVLSFGRGKGWTGMGGGALLWRGQGQAAGAAATGLPLEPAGATSDLRAVIRAKAQWLLGRPGLFALPAAIPWLRLGETIYHEPSPPRAMGRASAAIVLATRARADAEASVRRECAREYGRRLGVGDAAAAASTDGSGALRYPVLIERGWEGMKDEAERLGAGPPYPSTLAELPALRKRLVNPDAAQPGAIGLVRELVTLPTHGLTRPAERARLCELVAPSLRRTIHS